MKTKDNVDGMIKVDIMSLKARDLSLRKQLGEAYELLVRRGWWSYLTDFPILDHDLIMHWITDQKLRNRVSLHYLWDDEKNMWKLSWRWWMTSN